MKNGIIFLACLVVGVAAGTSATYLLLTRHYNDMLESRHAIMALDQVNVLSHLKGGKGDELMKTIEERLPQWAAAIPVSIQDTQRANQVLWQVQRYYEEYEVEIPEALRPVLDALPPRPPARSVSRQRPVRSVYRNVLVIAVKQHFPVRIQPAGNARQSNNDGCYHISCVILFSV